MLEARQATVHLGGQAVLDGLSLAVHPGEVSAVIGPNGAGKSTLLAALSGAQGLTGGHISIDAAPIDSLRPNDLSLRRAVLEQSPPGDVPFTPRALLGLAINRAVAPDCAALIIRRALSAVGLTAMADRPLDRMSGGQAHRAHLARSLAQLWAGRSLGFGRYLLIDEPTANLDPLHQGSVFDIARQVAADGAGVLIVLHDLTLAAAIADRVVLMDQGRIAAQGAPDLVLTPATLSRVYGTAIEVSQIDDRMAIFPRFGTSPNSQPQHPN